MSENQTTTPAHPVDLSGVGLQGSTTLVAGGTGSVGYYLVDAFLRAGASVLVPTRSQEKFDRLLSRLPDAARPRVTAVRGDLGSPEGARLLHDQVADLGVELRAVAASPASWHQGGGVVADGFAEFRSVIETRLYPHFLALEAFLPLLATDGAYVSINGPVGFLPELPAGLGAIAAALAAQNKLVQTAGAGTGGHPRVNDVVIYAYIGPDGTQPFSTLAGERVGDFVAGLAGTPGAAVHGQTLHIRTAAQADAAVNGSFTG